jgi:2-polyprenyl-3-methyl-5-hydroxy-6-metoxy-1,4-benzoquinol methylase
MLANKTFWDSYASDFDAINNLFRKSMKIRFERTMLIIPEDEVSVIDIGCGSGHYCFSLAQHENREILGIDFSEKMIQLTTSHALEFGIEKNLEF